MGLGDLTPTRYRYIFDTRKNIYKERTMTHGHGHALPAGFDLPVGPREHRHLRRFLAFMEEDHEGRGRHGRRGHRGGRGGPGGPGDFMFRFGPPGGRGPRARRGDVRAAALLLLAEEPRNGY